MYAFVEAEKVTYPIALLCRVLRLPKSAFYASRAPKVTARQVQEEQLRPKIERLFTAHKKRYGQPRIATCTAKMQDQASRVLIACAAPMYELGLQVKTRHSPRAHVRSVVDL